jgi:signal transduction histidine kinase
MNNAVSFTPAGGEIKVLAQVKNGEAHISVTDTGIGLTTEQFERIFEEFYQVEDHMTRQHGGLGIGLSICRAVIASHGGRVWAQSPGLGQGSTFTVALPLAPHSEDRPQ